MEHSIRTRHVPILRTQEVLAIIKEHVLDTWLEKNRAHRPLWRVPVPLASTVESESKIFQWCGLALR